MPAKAATTAATAESSSSEDSSDSEEEKKPAKAPAKVESTKNNYQSQIQSLPAYFWDVMVFSEMPLHYIGSCEATCCSYRKDERQQLKQ